MNILAPFQWYGNKREAAGLVWRLLGDPTIYLEPFFGAGGVLLNRPTAASSWQLEVVNDIDGALVNAWRALRADPEGLADLLMDPITEIDKHARGAAVIAWRESEGREHLGGDPYFYDLEMAAFWLYFACLMIGGGHGPWVSDGERLVKSETGHGIRRSKPSTNVSGYLRSRTKGREALTLYFMVLSERLKNVVVLNGGWERCVTSSMLNGNRRFSADMSGCAVFLDPPYADTAERSDGLYGCDSLTVAHEVREWCLANADRPNTRIVLAGFEGEHGSALIEAGWTEHRWERTSTVGRGSQFHRERLWASPQCQPASEPSLFDH